MADNTARAAVPEVPALDFERPVVDLERKIEELVMKTLAPLVGAR